MIFHPQELEAIEPCERLRTNVVVCGDHGGSDPALLHDALVFAEDEDSEAGLLRSLHHVSIIKRKSKRVTWSAEVVCKEYVRSCG